MSVRRLTRFLSLVRIPAASLDNVRVVVSKDDGEVPINQLATVAVKGNSLVVDVFDAEVRPLVCRRCVCWALADK